LAHLSAFVNEDELDGIVCAPGDRDHLCRNPGLVFVFKPDPGTLAVYVLRHEVIGDGGEGKERVTCVCDGPAVRRATFTLFAHQSNNTGMLLIAKFLLLVLVEYLYTIYLGQNVLRCT
jgi:hypothetical protein